LFYEQSFIKPWIEHTRKERELKEHLISGLLSHAQSDRVGRLLKDDGTPDKDAIKRSTCLYFYTNSIYELN